MRRIALHILMIALATACVGCVVGCTRAKPAAVGNTGTASEAPLEAGSTDGAKAAPQTPTPGVHDEWLKRSPWRENMRAMWAECGMIVSLSNLNPEGNFDSIAGAAENIARKALRNATFWKTVANGALATSRAAKTQSWNQARESFHNMADTCCACHIETWPLELRGFTAEVLETWRKEGAESLNARWSGAFGKRLKSEPKTPHAVFMRLLDSHQTDVDVGVNAEDSVATEKAATEIWKIADDQFNRWNSIQNAAKSIAAAAERKDFEAVRRFYLTLRSTCIACHAAQTTGVGEILHPPEWK